MRESEAIDGRNGTRAAAEALALRALGWTLVDSGRALRLLDVTGLTPADLRSRASDPAVLTAGDIAWPADFHCVR
jgi:hypothetical protein